jgi:hypothetical protein
MPPNWFANTVIWSNRLFMRSPLFLITALCCTFFVTVAYADLKPADGGAPVFQVFAANAGGGGGSPRVDISGKPPLMVVSTVSNVQLSKDRKAVRLTMNRSDAHRFAEITRKHAKDLLILESNGKVLEAMRVSSPVTDGVLEFEYPGDAAVADYLRKRFRLK